MIDTGCRRTDAGIATREISSTGPDRMNTQDHRPTISVVIPTCSRDDFLPEAVQSALDQSVAILEVIVIDDASDTDPRPQLERFGERVRYERLAQRSGANVARNRGIELARGDLVALLDDDDLWLPEKTETQLRVMGDAGEACLCIARDLDGPPDAPWRMEDVEQGLRRSNPCGTSGLIARREALLAEPFDPELRRAQDWDVFVRLARRGTLVHVDEPLYLRRVGHARITTAALSQSPRELYATAAAAHKHRAWLGERAYRRRLAILLLSFISQRRNKLCYIAASLWHAGPRATIGVLASKLR
ncbi:glycosyltransferase [Salipiger mucosus DSM 16094]|uniref:Glycosyltransferase n=2 Tax=Salipiger mucosus TaxID=263378 RepID=S9QUC0_9RHOB|nr:glycosyltransferase [Salipiger mucosus DSM 16094]